MATGGVQAPDESNELNAMRELEEEVGVSKPIEDFKMVTQFSYQDNRTHVWGNVFHIKLDHEAKDLKL